MLRPRAEGLSLSASAKVGTLIRRPIFSRRLGPGTCIESMPFTIYGKPCLNMNFQPWTLRVPEIVRKVICIGLGFQQEGAAPVAGAASGAADGCAAPACAR